MLCRKLPFDWDQTVRASELFWPESCFGLRLCNQKEVRKLSSQSYPVISLSLVQSEKRSEDDLKFFQIIPRRTLISYERQRKLKCSTSKKKKRKSGQHLICSALQPWLQEVDGASCYTDKQGCAIECQWQAGPDIVYELTAFQWWSCHRKATAWKIYESWTLYSTVCFQ